MVAVQQQSSLAKNKPSEKISWETFEEEYLSREDGYKYEWVDGYVEKTPTGMNTEQLYILRNIRRFFTNLDAKNIVQGILEAEVDTFFDGNYRRPDIAFLTDNQIEKAKLKVKVVPNFVIEIVSTNDQVNRLQKKMDDYDRAKVAVVWHVFPLLKKVHVYKGNQMLVCREEDICSAEPVIKGFKMSVKEIFA